MIEAVTFDFWNTLVRQPHRDAETARVDAWLGVLTGEGIALERARLEAVFAATWEAFQQRWRDNIAFHAREAVDHNLELLGLDPPPRVREALVRSLTDPPPEHRPDATPNIRVALEPLAERGVRLGIICDVGLTPSRVLRRYLGDHGLLALFDHWSFSDEVGSYKPHAAIFTHALEGLGGVAPSRAAHVGDLRRTDVAGARAMGMTAVRYTGVFDDTGEDAISDSGGEGASGEAPEADVVIADHAELGAVLGFA